MRASEKMPAALKDVYRPPARYRWRFWKRLGIETPKVTGAVRKAEQAQQKLVKTCRRKSTKHGKVGRLKAEKEANVAGELDALGKKLSRTFDQYSEAHFRRHG